VVQDAFELLPDRGVLDSRLSNLRHLQ